MTYDSREDTQKHIDRVRELLRWMGGTLSYRGYIHDRSKLHPPEKEVFDRETPRLKELTYGSTEYTESLNRLGTALYHHYQKNRHHPEYHAFDKNGVLNPTEVKDGTAISRMTLNDIVEMLCDWKAASERHADGNIYTSIEKNQERFGYSDELKSILINTAKEMFW